MGRIAQFLKTIWLSVGTPRYFAVFIAIWAAVVLAGGIPHGDLSGYDDAAYAHEARAMVQSGDVWTLSLNGEADFDKPPLFIWLVALSFKLFGVSDAAAKVPGVVLGWATIVLVYFLAKEMFSDDIDDPAEREWLAVLSMLCMATTQYFLKYASHPMTDVPFTFFFTLAIYFFVLTRRHNAYLLASGAATGLAVLVRSPMGFFPAVIIIVFISCCRRFDQLFSVYFLGFLLICLAIPATWYAREYLLFGDTFVTRHVDNFLAHSAAGDGRTSLQHFLWYFEYLFQTVQLYIPWFPFMFYGMYLSLKKAQDNAVHTESLLFIWLVIVVVPFSFADAKIYRYIMPAFPVFAIFSAYALTNLLAPTKRVKAARIVFSVLAPAAIVVALVPNYLTRAEDMRVIAPMTDAATALDEKVVVYTYGELKWDLKNQLIWYGHRNALLTTDVNDIEKTLADNKQVIVVMDKLTFENMHGHSALAISVIGESSKFVCFRAAA